MSSGKYKIIVFDLGNVLIDVNRKVIVEKLNKIEYGLGEKYHGEYLSNRKIFRNYESGKINDKEFIDWNLNILNLKITAEQFCKIYSGIFNINKKVVNLLPLLKKKYRLVLLSNTNNIHQKYGWENYSFIKHFEKLVLSHKVGALKPEEKIYKAVESHTKELPDAHLFIDDIKDFTEAAKQLGWDGIQFVGYENLLKEFKSRKIL